MSSTAPHRGRSDPATGPVADLAAELVELGFEPQTRPVLPGQVVYTATDSPVTITVHTDTLLADPLLTDAVLADPNHPSVRAECTADGHPWRVEWTAATPIHVQLIALYAILNHDPAVALSAAATALGAPPVGAEPGKRYPAG
jgi:hypothetical protein